jgi:hypothetical protein
MTAFWNDSVPRETYHIVSPERVKIFGKQFLARVPMFLMAVKPHQHCADTAMSMRLHGSAAITRSSECMVNISS